MNSPREDNTKIEKSLNSDDTKTLTKDNFPKFSISDYLPNSKLDFEDITYLNENLDQIIRDSIYYKFGVVDNLKTDDDISITGVPLYFSPQQKYQQYLKSFQIDKSVDISPINPKTNHVYMYNLLKISYSRIGVLEELNPYSSTKLRRFRRLMNTITYIAKFRAEKVELFKTIHSYNTKCKFYYTMYKLKYASVHYSTMLLNTWPKYRSYFDMLKKNYVIKYIKVIHNISIKLKYLLNYIRKYLVEKNEMYIRYKTILDTKFQTKLDSIIQEEIDDYEEGRIYDSNYPNVFNRLNAKDNIYKEYKDSNINNIFEGIMYKQDNNKSKRNNSEDLKVKFRNHNFLKDLNLSNIDSERLLSNNNSYIENLDQVKNIYDFKGRYNYSGKTEIKEFNFIYNNKLLRNESIFSSEDIKSGRKSELGNFKLGNNNNVLSYYEQLDVKTRLKVLLGDVNCNEYFLNKSDKSKRSKRSKSLTDVNKSKSDDSYLILPNIDKKFKTKKKSPYKKI